MLFKLTTVNLISLLLGVYIAWDHFLTLVKLQHMKHVNNFTLLPLRTCHCTLFKEGKIRLKSNNCQLFTINQPVNYIVMKKFSIFEM